MAQSVLTVATTVESLTELREAAKNLLGYVAYANQSDINATQELITAVVNNQSESDSQLSQKLLGNSEAVPLYDDTVLQSSLEKSVGILHDVYSVPEKLNLVRDKKISAFFHRADSRVDYASMQSDVSALFCNQIPAVDLSLCVPYFDARIIYPRDGTGVGQLNPLRFVGLGTSQLANFVSGSSNDTSGEIGFDVAGMEIFCMPQTLVGDKSQLNSAELLSRRGVEVLDPMVPLMTLESANVQQVGIGGSLYAQTKVDLSIILHDRSRLSDIEPLVSVEVFPTLTFQIEYGWAHPDTNKMTGGAYAKLLNAMRTKQQFALYSVSVSTRDATSLKISISLMSKGAYITNNASVVTAGGEYVPYTVIQSLLRQFVSVTSTRNSETSSNTSNTVTYSPSKVGTINVASTSASATSNRFVKIESFYDLKKTISEVATGTTNDSAKIDAIIKNLTALETGGVVEPSQSYLDKAINFTTGSADTGFGENVTIFEKNQKTLYSKDFDIFQKVNDLNKNANVANVVPLVSAVGQLVAKPILLTQPDISEVRIHCFSFNKACGLMAGENIGNFPIVIPELLEKKEGDKIVTSGINLRSTAQSALNKIIKQVNSPGSRYFGFSAETAALQTAVDATKQALKESAAALSGDDDAQRQAAADAQQKIQTQNEAARKIIDEKNKTEYLTPKGINTNIDSAFVPARVKFQIDTVSAGDGTKSLVRIIIYDDRAGGHNDLANLVFSMQNTNGLSVADGVIKSSPDNDVKELFKVIKDYSPAGEEASSQKIYGFTSREAFRDLVSKLYPTLIVGTEGSTITSANYTSQPSGDVGSSYLLTAISEGSPGSSAGASSTPDLLDDVLVIPATLSINMLGNPCMSRGQVYYVDFGTGTTLDNSYSVQAVVHNFRPGSFTTSVTLVPTNSATMRSVARQLNEVKTLLENSKTSLAPAVQVPV